MKVELLHITEKAEELIETAARTCYKSEVTENNGKFIKNLIRMDHLSVLEHASATFRISEVSRALTHQLVRHRICSFSQQSQRYVKESQFEYVVPESVLALSPALQDHYHNHMKEIQKMYDFWKMNGLKNEDARFVLPNACHSEIVISANFREFRTIFKVRCDKHAQWEIRKMATNMLGQLYDIAPNVFEDLKKQFIG